jgi:hypothetical protein
MALQKIVLLFSFTKYYRNYGKYRLSHSIFSSFRVKDESKRIHPVKMHLFTFYVALQTLFFGVDYECEF